MNEIPAVASPSSVAPPPWIELPGDVTANILGRLDVEEILESAQKVCTTWRKVCQEPSMWRVIKLPKCHIGPHEGPEYVIMCRRAVDLSAGQLVDLTLEYFADDELINYIVDRSSHLKRLTLRYSYYITRGLVEAVKKLPELEELHLMCMSTVLAEEVEEIGISCPKLKSFSYFAEGYQASLQFNDIDDQFDGNDYALAVGKSMPNLHHLGLFADGMRNEALQVILDGCPTLESLDIRQCFGLDLGGGLGKRCREQIKNLKLPSDSTSDIPWFDGGTSHSESYDHASFDTLSDYDEEEYDGSPIGNEFFGGDVPDFFDHDDL